MKTNGFKHPTWLLLLGTTALFIGSVLFFLGFQIVGIAVGLTGAILVGGDYLFVN